MLIKLKIRYWNLPKVDLKFKKLKTSSIHMEVDHLELSYIAGDNVRQHNHFGKLYFSSL